MKPLLVVIAVVIGGGILIIAAAVIVWAVDANYVQVPTIIYASTIGIVAAAALFARRAFPKSGLARASSVAFVIIALIGLSAYVIFRWHAEHHRPKLPAEINTNNAPASTPTPIAPTPKDSNKTPKEKSRNKK